MEILFTIWLIINGIAWMVIIAGAFTLLLWAFVKVLWWIGDIIYKLKSRK